MSRVYAIKAVQKIPVDIDTAWRFFSSAANLAEITPSNLAFRIITKYPADKMHAGQIIEYKLRPIPGVSFYWMTEITHINDKVFFIDEQRFGPYSLWHHEHHFRQIEGGVEMTDIVYYKIPYWFLGTLANWLFVHKQLREVFNFRYKAIEDMFGKWQGQTIDITFS